MNYLFDASNVILFDNFNNYKYVFYIFFLTIITIIVNFFFLLMNIFGYSFEN